MKKIYTLSFFLIAALSANAQTNLVPNGNFETWTDGAPEGYIVYNDNGGSLTQETTDIHGGTSAALFTAPPENGNVKAIVADIPVTAGNTYVFSYWVKDEGDNAKGRHWASWRSGSDQLDDNLDVLHPDFLPNTSGWEQVTYTMVAPATADAFRIDFRVYKGTDAGSGLIYYDDVMFYDQATAGIKENKISGLKMYPNPLSGNILNITSDANAAKTVAVYDVLGKQVINTITANGTVNVSGLTSGVYIVKITEEGKTATKKLVVK